MVALVYDLEVVLENVEGSLVRLLWRFELWRRGRLACAISRLFSRYG